MLTMLMRELPMKMVRLEDLLMKMLMVKDLLMKVLGEGVTDADFKDKDYEDESEAHLVLDILHNLEQRELLPGISEIGQVHIF